MPRKRSDAPIVEGSHTLSPVNGSSKLHFSSTASTPTVKTVSTHRRNAVLHPVARFVLLLISVSTISASLYTILDPFVDLKRAEVVKKPALWSIAMIAVARVVPLFVAYELGFDGFKVGALVAYLRQPFWLLLFLFYGVPLSTLAIDIGVDLVSAVGAFSLLGTVSKPYPKTTRAKALFYTPSNRVYVSLLTVCTLGVSLLLAKQSGLLSQFVIHNFYPVPTVEPLYSVQLPQAFALLLLSAFIPPILLAAPPRTPHFSFVPASVSLKNIAGRIVLLEFLVFLETASHTYAAIDGATLMGAVGYAAGWTAATALLGIVLTWISEGADVSEGDRSFAVVEDSDSEPL